MDTKLTLTEEQKQNILHLREYLKKYAPNFWPYYVAYKKSKSARDGKVLTPPNNT